MVDEPDSVQHQATLTRADGDGVSPGAGDIVGGIEDGREDRFGTQGIDGFGGLGRGKDVGWFNDMHFTSSPSRAPS